jgi:DNA-directed RNA polymerase specialized sigma24 family protein
MRSQVHRALEELPEHHRRLIELVYWSELSQSEIATHLDIPLGAVKTRARIALARLADLLEQSHRSDRGDPLRIRNRAWTNCQRGEQ